MPRGNNLSEREKGQIEAFSCAGLDLRAIGRELGRTACVVKAYLSNPQRLWGILVRRIYNNNRQFRSVDELKGAILDAWQNISLEDIKKLVKSIPNRIFQVINRSGGLTDC